MEIENFKKFTLLTDPETFFIGSEVLNILEDQDGEEMDKNSKKQISSEDALDSTITYINLSKISYISYSDDEENLVLFYMSDGKILPIKTTLEELKQTFTQNDNYFFIHSYSPDISNVDFYTKIPKRIYKDSCGVGIFNISNITLLTRLDELSDKYGEDIFLISIPQADFFIIGSFIVDDSGLKNNYYQRLKQFYDNFVNHKV